MPVFEQRVSTRPLRVLLANPNRADFSIINESSEDVYVGYAMDVSTLGFSTGIPVKASGGSMEDKFHRGEVWVVANADTTVTAIEDTKPQAKGVK